MKPIIFLSAFLFLFPLSKICAQTDGEWLGGKYRITTYEGYGNVYRLFDFSRKGNSLKAKYFAINAYDQYIKWRGNKKILMVIPGACSTSFAKDGIPGGLTIDNGVQVNNSIDNVMDGMVVVYNGGAQQGGIAVVDLDVKPVTVEQPLGSGEYKKFFPRKSYSDRLNFLQWGEKAGVTLFQTQLVYSNDRVSNFSNLYYGKKAERRFLAICKKNGVIHHVVVDAPNDEYLNLAAKQAKEALDMEGFYVYYIMNFDTGGKNILYAYNGSYLINYRPSQAEIEDSTNLLIYYMDN